MMSPKTSVVMLFTGAVLTALSGCVGSSPPSPSPSSPAASSSAVPLISLDAPAASATVHTPVTLSGTADTFEAALTVDALAADGSTLCVRDVTATSGRGTPGTWSAVLAAPPASAAGPITLRAYSFSAKDGSMINLVTRRVTLSADRPAIVIDSPACGATVPSGRTVTVSGSALVFEAAFTLELRDPAGATVVSRQVMASRGDQVSPWSASLAIPAGLAAGSYDLVAFDNSAKDGSVIDVYPVQVQLR